VCLVTCGCAAFQDGVRFGWREEGGGVCGAGEEVSQVFVFWKALAALFLIFWVCRYDGLKRTMKSHDDAALEKIEQLKAQLKK
jgi:hypothetical protein